MIPIFSFLADIVNGLIGCLQGKRFYESCNEWNLTYSLKVSRDRYIRSYYQSPHYMYVNRILQDYKTILKSLS